MSKKRKKSGEKKEKSLYKKLQKSLSQRAVSRGIIRKNQMVVKIPNTPPAPYVPIYFKQELEEARKSMFFQ